MFWRKVNVVAPVRERLADIIKQGKSENDVLAARARLGYDGIFAKGVS
jgi:hypothetical protein